MKYLKLYEDFKLKNITQQDIRNCVMSRGFIFSDIVKGLPDNEPDKPLRPIDIDDDGLITVDLDGQEYLVDLDDVTKVEI